ncbi:BgTH12-05666 [Blumeria graminis f. sp. triticale]|uniref:BgTH12-05666 n=1 Tax=Blumeria graminis f. sp. triticale TaxID=1689686 RepID=A0A9W4D4C0_BLUGR|nr:BgTH12-05666 [Blumeria graminis f. sp. triticale]
MRSCIIALILQSVSLSVAVLKSYQRPHIPEEQKNFNCDGRVYGYGEINRKRIYRVNIGRNKFEPSERVNFDELAMRQDINTGFIYQGKSKDTKHNLQSFYSESNNLAGFENVQDFLVYDHKGRACAFITLITKYAHKIQFSDGSWDQPSSRYEFCHLQ